MEIIPSRSSVRAADEKDEKRRRNRKWDKKTDGTGCSQQACHTVVSPHITHPCFLLSSSRQGLFLTLSQHLPKTFLKGHSLAKLFHAIYLLLFAGG